MRLPSGPHWNALDWPPVETLQLDRTRPRGEEPPRQTLVAAVSKAESTCKARRYSHLTMRAVAEDAYHSGRLTWKTLQLDRTRLRGEEPPRQTLVGAVSEAEPACKARSYSHLTTTAVAEDAYHPGCLTRKEAAGWRLLHLRVSANSLVLGRWNWPRHEPVVVVSWMWPVRHCLHALAARLPLHYLHNHYLVLRPPGAGRLGCRLRGWVYPG
jgi:hypothetical protein